MTSVVVAIGVADIVDIVADKVKHQRWCVTRFCLRLMYWILLGLDGVGLVDPVLNLVPVELGC